MLICLKGEAAIVGRTRGYARTELLFSFSFKFRFLFFSCRLEACAPAFSA